MTGSLATEDVVRLLERRNKHLCAHCGVAVARVVVSESAPGAMVAVWCHGAAHKRYFSPTDRHVEDGEPFRWFSTVPKPEVIASVTIGAVGTVTATLNHARARVEYSLRHRDIELRLKPDEVTALLLIAERNSHAPHQWTPQRTEPDGHGRSAGHSEHDDDVHVRQAGTTTGTDSARTAEREARSGSGTVTQ